jgi:glycosyltransferase involved in cell wall biosynthesis
MMSGNRRNLLNRLRNFTPMSRRRRIYYVTDGSNWSFHWDAYYIVKELKSHVGNVAAVTRDPGRLKNQIIQFGDRYAYLNGAFRHLHPSNNTFLTWFHGDPTDPNPEMQRLFAVLPEAVESVDKVVVSCRISETVLRKVGISGAKVVVIPLGVDLTRFRPPDKRERLAARLKLGIAANQVCIGYFQKDGNGWGDGFEPKPVKGPDVFLDVIARLSGQFKNMLILLTGPARGYVKRGLAKIGVPYIHHFVPHYLEIVRYYHTLDLYMITSRAEGGPKALLESWATGVPVVSTRVGMAADLIRHQTNGMLAEIEDVSNLVDRTAELIEDRALRLKFSKRAYQATVNYDWPLIAGQYYHQLYKGLL